MFGRIKTEDYRDAFYDGADLVKPTFARTKYWVTPPYSQDETKSHSPGVAWYQWYISRLKLIPEKRRIHISAYDFYKAGEVDGKSTIRGGAKLLRGEKLIRSYYWTTDIDVLVNYILVHGPAVIGSSWKEGMMNPQYETGLVDASGNVVGEAAYVIDGVNLNRKLVRIRTPWEYEWGRNGHCYLPISDFAGLLKDGGEACLPVGFGNRWRLTK